MYKGSNWTRGELGHDPVPSESEEIKAVSKKLLHESEPDGIRCRECGATDYPSGPQSGLVQMVEWAADPMDGYMDDDEFRKFLHDLLDEALSEALEEGEMTEKCHKPLTSFDGGGSDGE